EIRAVAANHPLEAGSSGARPARVVGGKTRDPSPLASIGDPILRAVGEELIHERLLLPLRRFGIEIETNATQLRLLQGDSASEPPKRRRGQTGHGLTGA